MDTATDAALHVPLDGPPVNRTPTLKHECVVAGFHAMALPPRRVELAYEADWIALSIVPCEMRAQGARIGGKDYSHRNLPSDSLAWYPVSTDLQLVCDNPEWEAVIEIDPARLELLDGDLLDGRKATGEFVPWTHDPLVGVPARLLIEHLRCPAIDPLYVEGLTLAVVARGIALASGGLTLPSVSGTDRRIGRAIDYLEAHLSDRLSVAGLAAVATMSPSHFARSFKSATGEAVWAYVHRLRVERAYERVLRTSRPLGWIAEGCGFSDAGHLSRAFRARYGKSPGEVRSR